MTPKPDIVLIWVPEPEWRYCQKPTVVQSSRHVLPGLMSLSEHDYSFVFFYPSLECARFCPTYTLGQLEQGTQYITPDISEGGLEPFTHTSL